MAQTEVQEWLELEERMKFYIKENTDEIWLRPQGGPHLPVLAENYGVMKSYLHDILDLDGARHRFLHDHMEPTSCEIGNPISKSTNEISNRIFDIINENILYIYDPCVQMRIWNAYHLQDKQFFRQLSEVISSSIRGNQKTKNYIYILRNFLVTLQDHAIVNLKEGDDKDWERAYSLVEKLRLKKPALKKLKISAKHLRGIKSFKQHCKKWFKE